jgi:Enolase C-terminal domain-like
MRFSVKQIDFFERQVRLRLPFRFGVVTMTEAPQAFVRARIALENGKEAQGGAAEMLVPKWFDKDPSQSNEDNIEQLRASLRLARDAYLAGGENNAFGHSIEAYGPQLALGTLAGMNNLTAGFGPALVDRALLDALCRALGASFYDVVRKNVPGITAPGWQEDMASFDMNGFLFELRPAAIIAARHTVGLVDPISAADVKEKLADGLPQTLEEVVARYGNRYFKLKLSGDVAADIERLAAIAAVLDRGEAYQVTLDGNEQFGSTEEVLALWKKLRADARLKRLLSSTLFIEQPIKRSQALASDVTELAEVAKPVIIDESEDTLEAFPRARRLGYTGVSSKTCKGLYKAILNAARCRLWNREEGSDRYFMSGEDLTIQAGIALQQDLALVSLIGLKHVERNGHHYVNGMYGLPDGEQAAFFSGHPDLYERSHGAVRLKIVEGVLRTKSLGCPGFGSAALPDWNAMKEMA